MSSLVYFKFKSNLTKQNIPFEGSAISVNDLKNAIRIKNGMKSNDFDLILMTTDGKDYGEKDLIPAFSSVIVKRVPVYNVKRVNKTLNPENFKRNDPYKLIRNNGDIRNFKIVNLATSDMTEDQKEDFVAELSSKTYNVTKRIQTGPAPQNYLCNRCNLPGHWIKDCPGIADKDGKLLDAKSVKRPSGIPTSNLAEVDSTTPNSYLTADGRYVVNKRNHEAYLKGKKDKRPFSLEENPPRPVQIEMRPACLVCGLCDEIFRNPVSTPCCGKVYCKNCAVDTIFDEQNVNFHKCPNCKEVLNVLASLTDQILLGEIINQWQIKKMSEGGLTMTGMVKSHVTGNIDEDDDLTNDIFGFSDKENGTDKIMLMNDSYVYSGLNEVETMATVIAGCGFARTDVNNLEAGSRMIPVLGGTRRDGSYGRGGDFRYNRGRREGRRERSRSRDFSCRRRRRSNSRRRRRSSGSRRRRREQSEAERSRSKRRKSRSTKEKVSSSVPGNEKTKEDRSDKDKQPMRSKERKKESKERDKLEIKKSSQKSKYDNGKKIKTVDVSKNEEKSSTKARDNKKIEKESKKCDTENNSTKKDVKSDKRTSKEVVSTTVSDKKKVAVVNKVKSTKNDDKNTIGKTEKRSKDLKKSNIIKVKEVVCDNNRVEGSGRTSDSKSEVNQSKGDNYEDQEVGTTIEDIPDDNNNNDVIKSHNVPSNDLNVHSLNVVSSTMEECADICDRINDNINDISPRKVSSCKISPTTSSDTSRRLKKDCDVKIVGDISLKRKIEIDSKEIVIKRVRTKSPVHEEVNEDVKYVERVIIVENEKEISGSNNKRVHIKSPDKEVKVSCDESNKSHSERRRSEKDKKEKSKEEGTDRVEISLTKEKKRHSSDRRVKDRSKSGSRHRRSKHRKKDNCKKRDESSSRSRSKTKRRKHSSKKEISHRKKSKDRRHKRERSTSSSSSSSSEDRGKRRRRSRSRSGSRHRRSRHRKREDSSEESRRGRRRSRNTDRKKHSKRRRRRSSTKSSDRSQSSEEYVKKKSHKKTKKQKTKHRHGKKTKKAKHRKKRR